MRAYVKGPPAPSAAPTILTITLTLNPNPTLTDGGVGWAGGLFYVRGTPIKSALLASVAVVAII